jgi:ankyrin repeat protein
MTTQDNFKDACGRGDLDAMESFLQQGADPDMPLPGDMFPILLAACRGLRAVLTLIRHGADPNKCSVWDGCTALHCAADLDTVTALIHAGADPDLRSSGGCTPLHTLPSWCMSTLLAGGGPIRTV